MLYSYYLKIKVWYEDGSAIRKYHIISKDFLSKIEVLKACYLNERYLDDIIDFSWDTIKDPVIYSQTIFPEGVAEE